MTTPRRTSTRDRRGWPAPRGAVVAARALLLGIGAALAGCGDGLTETARDESPPSTTVVAIACRVEISAARASCASGSPGIGPSVGMATAAAIAAAPALPGPLDDGLHIDLGGQGNTVGIALTELGLSGDSLLVATAVLTNRLDQPLGMVTPIGIDVNAVRLGIVDGPTALGGGTVTVRDPDGVAFFTAADQPFARFEAPVQPNQRAWRDLRFRLTGAVSSFTFRAIVRAALPDESPARVSGEPVRFASVSLSSIFGGCAVTATSQMPYCWGENVLGEVGDGRGGIVQPGPAGHGRFTRLVPTVLGSMCGFRIDGRAFCWGLLPPYVTGESFGDVELRRAFPGITARELAIGASFGCALDTAGRAWCAGANLEGQAGNGEISDVAFPGRVVGGLTFRTIAAGQDFACGITQARAVFCWGDNSFGQLGNGSLSSRPVPTRVAAITDSVVQVVTSLTAACALTQAAAVWCWGRNGFGVVGNGTSGGLPVAIPVRILAGGVAQLAAGHEHMCARRTDGTIACWGNDGIGQTGTGLFDDVTTPTSIVGSAYVADSLAVGGNVSCYRQAAAWTCWGANDQGEAGVIPAGPLPSPTPAGALGGLRELSLGLSGGCGLAASGDLWCWGRGFGSQFPDGQRTRATIPTGVFGGRAFAEVGFGSGWACGRRPAGGVYCWGVRHPGTTGSTTPDTLFSPVPFSTISVGHTHACGLSSSDGTAWCWGTNVDGESGVSGPASATPVQVTGAQRFIDIRAGANFTCALDVNGAPWCWGRNSEGQLGRGASGPGANPVPQRTSGTFQFTSLTAGPATACGVTLAREAVCWGSNAGDVLGLGAAVPRATTPGLAIGILQVRQLAIGGSGVGTSFGCGVTMSGELYCGGTGPLGTSSFETGAFRRVSIPVPVASVAVGNLGACAVDYNGRLWCWGSVGLDTQASPTPTLISLR